MNDIRSLLEAISEANRNTRKDYHLKLGEFIEILKTADQEALVNLGNPHSYRGYYADLALEPLNGAPIKVSQLIEQLTLTLDTFETGYKGGEFLMSADTPLWIAHYGGTGLAMLGFDPHTRNPITKEIR